MEDAIRKSISTSLLLTFVMGALEMQILNTKNLSPDEKDKEMQILFDRYAKVVIDSLDKGGYTIVPKEKIPNAFNF